MGRPPIGAVAMSGAERVRRFRQQHNVTKQDWRDQRIAELEARVAELEGPSSVQEPGDVQEPLTSKEEDQLLHLAIYLLVSVDHAHRKKFYKHLVSNSVDGVYLTSCSHRGWKGGRYQVDAPLLNRVFSSLGRQGKVCSLGRQGKVCRLRSP